MTVAKTKKLSFDEYLAHSDDREGRWELVNGEIKKMPPESRLNSRIALFLISKFLKFVPFSLVCCKDTEIQVSGRLATARIPDLMILTDELDTALGDRRGTITLDMPPPRLIVEVVSPGKENQDRDYRYKRSEYAARGVEEYWIIDPMVACVSILTLVNGLYEAAEFKDQTRIESATLPELKLTAADVLNAGTPAQS
ncbi:MAG: Uma2 family endonuclease [Cyanobacteria bacterium P01_H01_bin.26]